MTLRQPETLGSLALKLKWVSEQFMRDLPTMTASEKIVRRKELDEAEAKLLAAQAKADAEK